MLLPAFHGPAGGIGPLGLVQQVVVVVAGARHTGRPEEVVVLLVEPESVAHVRFELVLT